MSRGQGSREGCGCAALGCKAHRSQMPRQPPRRTPPSTVLPSRRGSLTDQSRERGDPLLAVPNECPRRPSRPSEQAKPRLSGAASSALRSSHDRQRAVLARDCHGRRGCDATRAPTTSAHPWRASLQDVPRAARRTGGTCGPPRPPAPSIREEPQLLRRVRDIRADASRRRRGRDLDAVRRRARVNDARGADATDGVQQTDEPLLRLREPRRDRQRRARRQARRRRGGRTLRARRRP